MKNWRNLQNNYLANKKNTLKTIHFDSIVESVKELCLRAATELPGDVYSALQMSVIKEQSPNGRLILQQCIENADLAKKELLPICQDTGFAVFYVSLGCDICIEGGLIEDAINQGVAKGYKEGFLSQ